MSKNNIIKVIGIMSGTSMDGIDVALLETDGINYVVPQATHYLPYNKYIKNTLSPLLVGDCQNILECENNITNLYVDAVKQLLDKSGLKPSEICAIGMSGQAIKHQPEIHATWFIGNGFKLAIDTNIPVISDFRRKDLALGGQGAPLVPVFHRALVESKQITLPTVIVNIGGVANLTYIDNDMLIAGDIGPGNALIDDIVRKNLEQECDKNGEIASRGSLDNTAIELYFQHPFFKRKFPKSLDRNAFTLQHVGKLKIEDALATLTQFTAEAIIRACKELLPKQPNKLLLTGGGRHNKFLCKLLSKQFEIDTVDNVLDIDGDMLEAYAFAYLAARHIKKLPISFNTTTGIEIAEATGGIYFDI